MLKSVRHVAVLVGAMMAWTPVANAEVLAKVSIASQTMNVFVDGALAYRWQVSTGRPGFETPRGSFRALWLDPEHISSIYEDAPMPNSVFFNGGYAIHGSYDVRHLGRRASHGCVRLSPANAATLYGLIEDDGLAHTHIVIR